MSSHSYTGIMAIMTSGMKVSGGKLESAETGRETRKRASLLVKNASGGMIRFDALSAADMLAELSDWQKADLARELKVSMPVAKAAAAPKLKASIDKAEIERERVTAYAQGAAATRASISKVLASPDSRGVEREAMTALAAGANPDKLLAGPGDRNTLVANMRARFGIGGNACPLC